MMGELLAEHLKEELAEEYSLGMLRKEYRVNRATVITGIVLIALGLSIYGVLFWLSSSESWDFTANVLLYGLIPLVLFSGIGILVLIFGGRWVSRRRNWRVYVYEHGLIYNGKSIFAMRWSSIKTVIHTITAHTSSDENGTHTTYTHSYKIFCQDGTELGALGIIDGTFAKKDELIRILEQESVPYLLEEALNDYRAENTVDFGLLSVNQQGITCKGELLAWQDLKKYEITGTRVSLWKRRKWLAWKSCELKDVTNYEVFKRLVETVRVG